MGLLPGRSQPTRQVVGYVPKKQRSGGRDYTGMIHQQQLAALDERAETDPRYQAWLEMQAAETAAAEADLIVDYTGQYREQITREEADRRAAAAREAQVQRARDQLAARKAAVDRLEAERVADIERQQAEIRQLLEPSPERIEELKNRYDELNGLKYEKRVLPGLTMSDLKRARPGSRAATLPDGTKVYLMPGEAELL